MMLRKLSLCCACVALLLGTAGAARAELETIECCWLEPSYSAPEGTCTLIHCGSTGTAGEVGDHLECTKCAKGYTEKTVTTTICGKQRTYKTCELNISDTQCSCFLRGEKEDTDGRTYNEWDCIDGTEFKDYTKCLDTEKLMDTKTQACNQQYPTHKCLKGGGTVTPQCVCLANGDAVGLDEEGRTWGIYTCGDSANTTFKNYVQCAEGEPMVSSTINVCDKDYTYTTCGCVAGKFMGALGKCDDCPPPGTSDAGATAITGCYVKNVEMEDDTGTYVPNDRCYYPQTGISSGGTIGSGELTRP